MSHAWTRKTAIMAVLLTMLAITVTFVALRTGVADSTSSIIWEIRAPRVIMALLIGAGLAVAGGLMQGSLSNPLADPGIVGVSAGAALGTVIAVTLGLSFATFGTALAASLGAAAALAVVISVSMHDKKPEVVTLLLAGVAVTGFAGAALAILVSMSSNAAVRSITFWSSGSFSLTTWDSVTSVAPFILAGLILAFTVTRQLDVAALGDRDAMAAGVNITRMRMRALLAVVLLVAAGVGTVGVIAFVGLLIPHAVRMVIGPRHAPLLLISGITGALFLLLADTLARTIANPLEIPVGAITAIVGAPVFFLLIRRTRARQGGWA